MSLCESFYGFSIKSRPFSTGNNCSVYFMQKVVLDKWMFFRAESTTEFLAFTKHPYRVNTKNILVVFSMPSQPSLQIFRAESTYACTPTCDWLVHNDPSL